MSLPGGGERVTDQEVSNQVHQQHRLGPTRYTSRYATGHMGFSILCVAGEFAWYVLLWNLLALGWCLVSV